MGNCYSNIRFHVSGSGSRSSSKDSKRGKSKSPPRSAGGKKGTRGSYILLVGFVVAFLGLNVFLGVESV